MKYTVILLILIPSLLHAQPFTWRQEFNTIPVEVNGYDVPIPWIGGYQHTTPEFSDIDGDGDRDLLLGNGIGNLVFFENTGTMYQPEWLSFEDDFQDIIGPAWSVCKLVDIDSDGDEDLFFDCGNIYMQYYSNEGSTTYPIFSLVNDTLFDLSGNPIDATSFCLTDIDNDNDFDLFTGVWYTGGIKYYQNVGDSTSFTFSLITSNFENINPGSWCSPCFCDIDADDDLDLFIGNGNGKIWFYRNDGTPLQYDYTLVSDNWLGIDVDEYATPEFCDIDGDGDYDLWVGKDNFDHSEVPGDMLFYRNTGTTQVYSFTLDAETYLTLDFGYITNPGIIDINFDFNDDLFYYSGYVGWLKNTGILNTPAFQLQSYNVTGSGFPAASVNYGDLNGDNSEDIVVVYGWTGIVHFWYSNGDTVNPSFYEVYSFDAGDMAGYPILADMDGDGDNDFILGVSSYSFDPFIHYYENIGDPESPHFSLTTTNYLGWAELYDIFTMVDFDGDLDFDAVVELDSTNNLTYIENVGTAQNPQFGTPYYDFIPLPDNDMHFCDFSDIDNDGDMDAFVASAYGGIRFFRNTTGDTSAVQPRLSLDPHHGIQFSLGPNPANPVTWISYNLPYPQKAEIAVYNLLGQKVATLVSGMQMPGQKTLIWDAAKYSSGQYFIRMALSGSGGAGRHKTDPYAVTER
ncbi:T9SS type A sorting domain-containing protein, partial [bacterium]|nr:T9SS type A sorting domain-containing protein [bacterium]